MVKEKYLIDYNYLYDALKKHPLLQNAEKMSEYERLATILRTEVQNYDSLVNTMTILTLFFQDGHTNIEIPYTDVDLYIGIICEWRESKLFLQESYESIEAGAEIVAVEGVKPEYLLHYASSMIPHENEYLVKSRMLEYPYKNYHIFSDLNLKRLFGNKTHYEFTFKVQNVDVTKQCALAKYDGRLDFQEDNFIYYEMQGNKAILHLDSCVYNEEYKQTLEDLAKLCKDQKIEILELDLSKNMGGSSAVIDEFIKYIDIGEFRRYEMIDYSADPPKVVTSRKDIISNSKKEILFPKKIICRVSHTTFSSARTFAVTLKDNHLATIIGQPTGGKPCSYGMPRRDKTPNCNIKFRVSRCLFLRPDDSLDDEMALFPERGCAEAM